MLTIGVIGLGTIAQKSLLASLCANAKSSALVIEYTQ